MSYAPTIVTEAIADRRPKEIVSPPTWFLEGFEGEDRKVLRTPLRSSPFLVGRRSGCDLTLGSRMVSQRHAELYARGDILWLRDLGSTNGTFVNGQRLQGETHLRHGDILHFADLEFRLIEQDSAPSEPSLSQTLRMTRGDLLGVGTAKYRELRDMLRDRTIESVGQPLVSLVDGSILGYEMLGRGRLDGKLASPAELFIMAETIGLATELSSIFRDKAVEEALELPPATKIFVNTHPAELRDGPELLESVRGLRQRHQDRNLVLEIHESAVTDLGTLRELRRELDHLGVELAFDDFGTGQARLLELTDTAPHYLKFDVALIRNLHQAPRQRRGMVRTLVQLVLDMDIVAIAEGIEQTEEAKVCAELGFQYAQGYHFGRPAPIGSFLDA